MGARAAKVFFLLFLGVQLAVPAIQWSQPQRPAHFGWQMFSGYRAIPSYWLVHADGTEEKVNIEEMLVGMWRLDADYRRVLPDFLLRKSPHAVAVRWQEQGSDTVQEHRAEP